MNVSGDEKKSLTVPLLIERFRQIRKKEYTTDETLLTV